MANTYKQEAITETAIAQDVVREIDRDLITIYVNSDIPTIPEDREPYSIAQLDELLGNRCNSQGKTNGK